MSSTDGKPNSSPDGSENKAKSPSTLELMKASRRWLLFKFVLKPGADKPDKLPFYANGQPRSGKLDQHEDTRNFVTYEEAQATLKKWHKEFDGIGFALGADLENGRRYWQGIDLDKIALNGLEYMVDELPGYVEQSPSGAGVHAIGLGTQFRNRSKDKDKDKGLGIEAYSTGRFFTFTDKIVRDAPVTDFIGWKDSRGLIHLTPFEVIEGGRGGGKFPIDEGQVEDLAYALTYIPNKDRDEWKNVGMALASIAGPEGERLFFNWSKSQGYDEWLAAEKAAGRKHKPHNDNTILEDFASFKPDEIAYMSVFKMAEQYGFVNDGHWRKEKRAVESKGPTALRRAIPPNDLTKIKGSEFLLDGQIRAGSMSIAGMRGVGKTTMLVSLVSLITWLCPELTPMRPRIRRRVVWITEDVDQIWQIIGAMTRDGLFNSDRDALMDMLMVVYAERSNPKSLGEALKSLPDDLMLVNSFSRGDHNAMPLIILDTLAATVDLNDENSNAEMSRAVFAVRQAVRECSIWFITHTAKGHTRQTAIEDITSRGASSLEGDVQGTAIIAQEPKVHDKRYLVLGKKRFTAEKNEITATVSYHTVTTSEVWGDRDERVAYVTLETTDYEDRQEHKEAAEAAEEERKAVKQEASQWLLITGALRRLDEHLAGRETGYVIRQATGPWPKSVDYRGCQTISADKLVKEVCGVSDAKDRTTVRTVLFALGTPLPDDVTMYALRSGGYEDAYVADNPDPRPNYEIAGLGGGK